MPGKRLKVIVTRRLPEPVETRMGELFDVELNVDDHKFERAELADAMARAHVLVPTLGDVIDQRLLAHGRPCLGVGIQQITAECI